MGQDVRNIAERFAAGGRFVAARGLGKGHINDSYLLSYRQDQGVTRFLLQRVNDAVFPNPRLVMENIERITTHIAAVLQARGVRQVHRRGLTLVRTPAGRSYYRDDAGSFWRLYRFIERANVHEVVTTPEQAEAAGRAFGRFQLMLADLEGPRLHETIPNFHHTPLRFEALQHAIEADPCNRAVEAADEIGFALDHRPLASVLLEAHRRGEIPERIVHNDAKINNVLFDTDTGEGLCVIDLDTVMPGLSLYDFGDMVRSMTSIAAEDEIDLAKVEVEMPLFEALARGYLQSTGTLLTPAERKRLVTAGKLITLEQGVRFLTDFLNGDSYYRVQRPGHNLDRCRTQFKLVESITRDEARMNRFIDRL